MNRQQHLVDLQMDLLVDAELPEHDRRELLLSMDRDPARWRDLAIRFLERQVERRSVHQFAGIQKTAVAAELPEPSLRPWWPARIPQALAAGIMIVAIAATLVIVASRQNPLPLVPVPVTHAGNLDQPFFPAQSAMETIHPSNRSVVIQPDGNGNAVVIPVNTLPIKFY